MEKRDTGYNEAKIDTLSCALELGELSSGEFAWIEGISLETASMRLIRGYRYGLLSRRREGREYIYAITQKGIERLSWLAEYNEDEQDLGLSVHRCMIIRDNENDQIIDISNIYEALEDDEDLEEFLGLLNKRRCRVKTRTRL